ncbi:hypothetical protein [Echinicola vietnamensis]|uniref:Uncharacterized protein n=1 Tax=Echinicola vietnamensis (strain DSM 17526 / LMG 23754 / KMM 6221) TaxID=926556 RepID=L0G1K4_ECHVK|nr:hypothetical protein [Echinicola vietnamensis]AGA78886.1 hypothetical protein Echvi_2645 [Echinicola vietnamensis DSM 17526]
MADKGDKTKKLLEHLLGELYEEQSNVQENRRESFLKAQDGQYLGKITTNRYDNDSILNKYGPFGSRYSNTSIFNKYSPYGSRYGSYSINNPHSTQPPQLVINGDIIAYITKNRHLNPKIDPDNFISKLTTDPSGILRLRSNSNFESEFNRQDSYLEADDGTFLGKLTSNEYDSESVLNKYGNFGSQYSTTSIFNEYGTYGGTYSSQSPFNEYSTTPPKIYINGEFWGYLTVNEYLSGNKLNPKELKNWISQKILS